MSQRGRGPHPHQPVAVSGGSNQGLEAFLARPDRQSFRRRGPHQRRGVLEGFEQSGMQLLIRGSHGQADEGGGEDLVPLRARHVGQHLRELLPVALAGRVDEAGPLQDWRLVVPGPPLPHVLVSPGRVLVFMTGVAGVGRAEL